MNLAPCREVFFRCNRIDLMERTDGELLLQLKQLRNREHLTNDELLELEILCKWYDYHSWIASPKTHKDKAPQLIQLRMPP